MQMLPFWGLHFGTPTPETHNAPFLKLVGKILHETTPRFIGEILSV